MLACAGSNTAPLEVNPLASATRRDHRCQHQPGTRTGHLVARLRTSRESWAGVAHSPNASSSISIHPENLSKIISSSLHRDCTPTARSTTVPGANAGTLQSYSEPTIRLRLAALHPGAADIGMSTPALTQIFTRTSLFVPMFLINMGCLCRLANTSFFSSLWEPLICHIQIGLR